MQFKVALLFLTFEIISTTGLVRFTANIIETMITHACTIIGAPLSIRKVLRNTLAIDRVTGFIFLTIK